MFRTVTYWFAFAVRVSILAVMALPMLFWAAARNAWRGEE